MTDGLENRPVFLWRGRCFGNFREFRIVSGCLVRSRCLQTAYMAAGTIRVLRCAHPRYSWEVKWYEGGKRQRRYYVSEREARDFAAVKKREMFHAAPSDAPISTEERRAVIRARELGVPLLLAVEAYSNKLAAEQRSLPMAELVRRRMAAAARENQSPRYALEYSQAMKGISEAFGERVVTAISTEECAGWIFGGGSAASTVRKRRIVLSGLFAFGQRIGVVERNPAQLVKAPRAAPVESIGILTPAEARDYLLAVATLSPALLPLESICLFAGLRRAEAERLDWSAVHLDRGFIEIGAGIAKTRSRRLVDVEPVLAGILEQWERPSSGPVLPANARRMRNRALKAAGWQGDKYGSGEAAPDARPWPDNALRHSFVSYHLALYGDVARTEMQAGHDRKMLFAHYRELVTREAAEEFWSVSLSL